MSSWEGLPYKKSGIEILRNGCWKWLGTINSRGYGRITVDHRHMAATHYVWEQYHPPVPGGYELAHTCDNRWGVNPKHLECLPKSEHRSRDAEKRRSQYSPEEQEKRRKQRAMASWKRRYYKKKNEGF